MKAKRLNPGMEIKILHALSAEYRKRNVKLYAELERITLVCQEQGAAHAGAVDLIADILTRIETNANMMQKVYARLARIAEKARTQKEKEKTNG